MFDTHMHTLNSDGKQTVDDMCLQAVEKGFGGITITDHADMNFYESRNHLERIGNGIREIAAAKEKYADRLKVLCGVELGEYLYAPENAKKILALTDYDAILCSVHLVPAARWEQPYNRIPFSEDGSDEELVDYLKLYLDLLSDTIDAFDFDILAHLSCPVRYMTGLHERKTDIMMFEPKLREILQKLIDRNIALEWNTGGLNPRFHFCNIQNDEIFALYKSMGGNLVSLGSDAHIPVGICHKFNESKESLKKLGFEYYYYFENRVPQAVKL